MYWWARLGCDSLTEESKTVSNVGGQQNGGTADRNENTCPLKTVGHHSLHEIQREATPFLFCLLATWALGT